MTKKILLTILALSLSSCATMGNFAQGFSQGINSYRPVQNYMPAAPVNCTVQQYGSVAYANCQ